MAVSSRLLPEWVTEQASSHARHARHLSRLKSEERARQASGALSWAVFLSIPASQRLQSCRGNIPVMDAAPGLSALAWHRCAPVSRGASSMLPANRNLPPVSFSTSSSRYLRTTLAARDARRRGEGRENPRSHGVEANRNRFLAHGLGAAAAMGQLRKIAAHSALGHQPPRTPRECANCRRSFPRAAPAEFPRRADFLEARPRRIPAPLPGRIRPNLALGWRCIPSAPLARPCASRLRTRARWFAILRHARRVAAHHLPQWPRMRPDATASMSGRYPRAETAAQVERQVLIGETGHQVHLVARNVSARPDRVGKTPLPRSSQWPARFPSGYG